MIDLCHILSQYFDMLPSCRRLRIFREKQAKTLYRHVNNIHQQNLNMVIYYSQVIKINNKFCLYFNVYTQFMILVG